MPNIVFAPKPMVDPYAGKAGEMLGDLISTIGQIKELRQQRNQTNAVLEIMKTPVITPEQKAMGMPGMTELDKRTAFLGVAQQGGVMGQTIARQLVAEELVPEYVKKQRAANLASTEALAAWRLKGGARSAGGAGSNDASYARGQAVYNKALNDKNTYELTVKNNPGMKSDPKVVEQFDRQMKVGLDMQNRYSLAAEPGKPRSPGPPIGGIDMTALGYSPQQQQGSPGRPGIFSQSPQGTPVAGQPPSMDGNMGPPAPSGFVKPLQYQFSSSDYQPGEFAKPATPQQAKPQSQEQFEQTVSQMAKTDRAAAKAYYEKWGARWQ